MTKQIQITCPNCKSEIPIGALVIKQINAEFEKKIRAQIMSEKDLRISEKEKMISTLNGQLKEMTRKLELSSQQRQGEVLELELEDYLKSNFKWDTISEIPKGVKGADILQIINTPTKSNCGSILYEAKRTKTFSNGFIEKLKEDQRDKNATFAVLVSETLPKGVEKVVQIDGVWVCNFENFKTVCFVLREAALQLSNALLSLEDRGTKMEQLYSYLISAEFRHQIETIIKGFTELDSDLASERRSMELVWKNREKIIQNVLKNTIHFYSAIKSIAGESIPNIKALELTVPR